MKVKFLKENQVIFADERIEKQKARLAKLIALKEKKKLSKLTLEDIDEKLDIVLEMLEEVLEIK